MTLFGAKWKDRDFTIRIEWINSADIENKKHIEILNKITSNDKQYLVRKAAFEKLGDEKSALYQELIYAKQEDRIKALKAISNNDSLLKNVVIDVNDVSLEIKTLALNEIKIIGDLKDIVLSYLVDDEIKLKALHLIKNDSFIFEIITDGEIELNPSDLIDMVESQKVLIRIFNHTIDSDFNGRRIAECTLSKIKDQKIMKAAILDERTDEGIMIAAIDNLTDIELLRDIVHNRLGSFEVNLYAIKRLISMKESYDNIKEIIYQIVKDYYHSKNPYFSSCGDTKLLFEIIDTIEDPSFFKSLITKISSQKSLDKSHRYLFTKLNDEKITEWYGITDNCSNCQSKINWDGYETIWYCSKCRKIFCKNCIESSTHKHFDDEIDVYECIDCGKSL